MKYQCQITAQRKLRPLYFTSDEQFQWMIAILNHFIPDVALETEGLKAVGASLGIQKPESTGTNHTPMRSLPASLEGAYLQRSSSTPNQSDAMSEGSQSPVPSEKDRDEEVHGAESLIVMNDPNDAPSQQSTSIEIRTVLSYMELISRRYSTNER